MRKKSSEWRGRPKMDALRLTRLAEEAEKIGEANDWAGERRLAVGLSVETLG
jgi:hypothetical protein